MADQAITALPKKTYSGSSQIAATDYLLGIDSAEGYQMLIQDLGEYIINRATASLAGSTQTLASAISALNSNLPSVSTGTIESAIKNYVGQGKGFGHFIADKSVSDIPESSKDYKILFYREIGSNSVYVEAIANTDHRIKYIGRIYNYTVADAGLSNTWQLLPTRAEMDTLKVGTPINHMRFFGNNNKTYDILRFCYNESESEYIQVIFDVNDKSIALYKKPTDGTETFIGKVTLT